ncbi:MAG: hypothetical protein AB7D57_08170 [Desulfovibrionaceae bacterium]
MNNALQRHPSAMLRDPFLERRRVPRAARAARWAEALALLAAGGLLGWFTWSGEYWTLLNPRFLPLTRGCAAGLVLAGLAMPWAAAPRGGRATAAALGRALGLLAFAGLAFWGVAAQSAADAVRAEAPADPLWDAPRPPEAPRLALHGREYVKLNTAELVFLESDPVLAPPPLVALRGMVRTYPLPGGGQGAALLRLTVVCCLADAVATGVVLDGPAVADLRDGQWVRVAGRLEPAGAVSSSSSPSSPSSPSGSAPSGSVPSGSVPSQSSPAAPPPGWPGPEAVRLPGAMLTALCTGLRLAVDDAAPLAGAELPETPYIFEYRRAEPFAW